MYVIIEKNLVDKKDTFKVKLIKFLSLKTIPLLVCLERTYFPIIKRLFAHLAYLHLIKDEKDNK